MRTFQAAAAVFCLACICTETVTLLVGSGWARRCIKALAGLYILIVLLQLLPSARTELGKWTVPQSTPVSLPGLENQILADAQSRLEAQLESECRQQFGLDAVIRVILEQDGQTLQAVQASMSLPAGLEDLNAENEIETLIKAKGFADCLCFLQSGRADLTVMTSGEPLTAAQVAQIRDVVLSKSTVPAQNITVVEVK